MMFKTSGGVEIMSACLAGSTWEVNDNGQCTPHSLYAKMLDSQSGHT
jgi:hypothetical protein